jgi:hypothetical protein
LLGLFRSHSFGLENRALTGLIVDNDTLVGLLPLNDLLLNDLGRLRWWPLGLVSLSLLRWVCLFLEWFIAQVIRVFGETLLFWFVILRFLKPLLSLGGL